MSTAPLPSPVFISTGRRFDPEKAQPAPSTRPRCRALTVGGHRCKNKVLGGLHLCFSHYRNRRPALPDQPKNVSVPLLEDRSAIQLMTTQILHGILSHRLDPERARVALYAIRIAALTLPRPRQQPEPQPAEADETVAALGRDHEDFISADGDLSATELNPSCSVADSPEALAELINTLEPRNRCHPEDATPDVCPPDPSHDFETCACYTCADYRDWIQETTAALRSSSS
ncbi:MAG TPA: hypothetical protein VJS11_12210 [Acidobacteriaceae bacterium]|nr:hypothetical protein [Acidobacteriaceae bacterium]